MIWEASQRRALVFALILACLAGCKSLFGTQGPPDDPLFLNKKPVAAKAHGGHPIAPAYSEPAPPTNPFVSQDRAAPVEPSHKVAPVSCMFEPDDESQ